MLLDIVPKILKQTDYHQLARLVHKPSIVTKFTSSTGGTTICPAHIIPARIPPVSSPYNFREYNFAVVICTVLICTWIYRTQPRSRLMALLRLRVIGKEKIPVYVRTPRWARGVGAVYSRKLARLGVVLAENIMSCSVLCCFWATNVRYKSEVLFLLMTVKGKDYWRKLIFAIGEGSFDYTRFSVLYDREFRFHLIFWNDPT